MKSKRVRRWSRLTRFLFHIFWDFTVLTLGRRLPNKRDQLSKMLVSFPMFCFTETLTSLLQVEQGEFLESLVSLALLPCLAIGSSS